MNNLQTQALHHQLLIAAFINCLIISGSLTGLVLSNETVINHWFWISIVRIAALISVMNIALTYTRKRIRQAQDYYQRHCHVLLKQQVYRTMTDDTLVILSDLSAIYQADIASWQQHYRLIQLCVILPALIEITLQMAFYYAPVGG